MSEITGGVIGMSFEMAMSSELSRRQFHSIAQALLAERDGLETKVAQQAQMIEHLRGGPTPLYTAVDMANAARDGFMDGAASVVVTLSKGDSLARRMSGPQEDGSNPMISRADAVAAIEAAGGTVQGGTKCKDYGHGGFSCGADDCWLRSEPRP